MLSFKSPQGWEIPQDAQPGKPFSAVGTFMMDEDGTITLTEIDGSPIEAPEMEEEGEEEEVEVEEEETEPGMTDIDAAMARAAKMGVM
jgi:hypothetical protein